MLHPTAPSTAALRSLVCRSIPGCNGRPDGQVILAHWWRDRSQPSLRDALVALELADRVLDRPDALPGWDSFSVAS